MALSWYLRLGVPHVSDLPNSIEFCQCYAGCVIDQHIGMQTWDVNKAAPESLGGPFNLILASDAVHTCDNMAGELALLLAVFVLLRNNPLFHLRV